MNRGKPVPWGKTRVQLSRADGYIYFQRDVEKALAKRIQRERLARGVSFQLVAHEVLGLGPVRREVA